MLGAFAIVSQGRHAGLMVVSVVCKYKEINIRVVFGDCAIEGFPSVPMSMQQLQLVKF
jgi:ribosomal protein L14E/L6E/L27E